DLYRRFRRRPLHVRDQLPGRQGFLRLRCAVERVQAARGRCFGRGEGGTFPGDGRALLPHRLINRPRGLRTRGNRVRRPSVSLADSGSEGRRRWIVTPMHTARMRLGSVEAACGGRLCCSAWLWRAAASLTLFGSVIVATAIPHAPSIP